MNNPIIVTDRALSYYDAKLKEFIGANYGDGMLIDWEPMENGKNPFKLKIALKNRYGAELFSKIVDFPLEQTIVSGEYNNEDKSLVLYFQDGSYTSIPIEDLIEGLASKLDLEKKADLGEGSIISGEGYRIEVPMGATPFARINKIGGATYDKDGVLLDTRVARIKSIGANLVPTPYSYKSGVYNGVSISFKGDGSFKLEGTASSAIYLLLNVAVLPAGTYYVSDTGENDWTARFYVSLPTANYFKNSSFVLTEDTEVEFRLAVYEQFNGVATFYPMVNKGAAALPFSEYRENILEIPTEIQNLTGYGQSNPRDPGEYNYIDFTGDKFVSKGYIFEGAWVREKNYTDIKLPSIVGVEEGGTLILENEYGCNVPYEIEYTLNSNDVIGAKEFVGNLTGTAEVAKYYDDNGNPSRQTIGEALNKLLGAGNPIKITTESIGQLSTTQLLTGISDNIVANPPVAVNDIILDKYLDGDAAYLCFWLVTAIEPTGAYASNMTLQGAGNLYVGGGSASVADKAIADSNGRNIVDTYETKTDATSTKNELQTNIDTVDAARQLNTTDIANIKSGETVVKKAEADSEGNNIRQTYATKSALTGMQNTLQSNIDGVADIANDAKETANGIELIAQGAKELAQTANNNADSARARADRGVKSISATHTSSYYGQGTFKLNVTFVGGTTESFDITDELSGFIMDVFSNNQ